MYRSSIIHLAAALLLGLAAPVAAQDAPQPVSLPEALDLWARHSPELQTARSQLRSAQGAARQGRAIQNPAVSFTNEDLGAYSEQYLNVSQSVDFIWQAGPRGRRAEARRSEARATFFADSAAAVLRLKRVFVSAWEQRQGIDALEEAALVVARVLEDASARFAQDDLAGYDLRRLRVAQAGAELRLAKGRISLEDAERRLGAMLAGDGSLARVRAEEPRPETYSGASQIDASERALGNRPEIAAAQARVRAFDADASLAARSRITGTAFTAGFKHQSDGREGLFLGVQLPLPLLDRKGGAVSAAEARTQGSRSELESLRREVTREAALAAARWESATRLRSSLGGGVADASELLESATVAYAEGEVGVVELVDATQAFIDARLLDASVRAEVWGALFDLEHAIGGLVDEADTGVER